MLWTPGRLVPFLTLALSCGDDLGGGSGAQQPDASVVDAGAADAGPPASVAHCDYASLPPTAGAGGRVEAGPVSAGAAEALLILPISTALGGYTSRARFAGSEGRVDPRSGELSGSFSPSIGVESFPRVKAVAVSTPGDTVVLIKADLIFADDTLTADIAERLGPDYAGKVVFATTHSHAAPMQFSADAKLAVGGGILRRQVREPLLDQLVAVAQAALEARRPARVGVLVEGGFDLDDAVTRDRRAENDDLAGGRRDDDRLALIRVDGQDGAPIAVVPIFGMHGTVLGADNPLMSGDAPGAIDRALEEAFDAPVVVMYLQGAGGDVSPAGRGGVAPPAIDGEPFYDFARAESVGRLAAPLLMAAWERAGRAMRDSLAIEAVTRSVPLGPDAATFAARAGELVYAPFREGRDCDRSIFGGGGEVLSPIDEFNAPVGAALCGSDADALFPGGEMWNTAGLAPYRSCVRIDVAAALLGPLLGADFGPAPLCSSTRTTVSAVRLGDHVIATLPGEPLTLLADRVRELSPAAPERTIVLGYAQGHVGYLLRADDWLRGGYEPSINSWGPLEGEYVAERAAEVMALALSDQREDAAGGGADRVATPEVDDTGVPAPDPAPLAGAVPDALPDTLYVRNRIALPGAQPAATVPRVAGVARFVWIGEDPLAGTPRVTLQRQTGPGAFEDVTRRSGRPVVDGDVLLYWTPEPLQRAGGEPRAHHWLAEWQAVAVDGDLEDRAGLPLGVYRFSVTGTGYAVASEPFEVVEGPIAVTAAIDDPVVTIEAGYAAPEGWRLLDHGGSSNQLVVVRRGPIDVVLVYDDATTESFPGVELDAPGRATVEARAGGTVVEVRVTDRFGNAGSAELTPLIP